MIRFNSGLVRAAAWALVVCAACSSDPSAGDSAGSGGGSVSGDAAKGSGGTAVGSGGTAVGAAGKSAGSSGASGSQANAGGSHAGAGNAGSGSGGRAAAGSAAGTPAMMAADASVAPAPDASVADRCADPQLKWRSANKTNYTSYPDPGSEECVKYNGCTWAGQFAACDGKKTEAWVEAHNIVAAFPDFDSLELHDLCLRSGSKTIVVTVYDTCGDSDCDGCCTENKGNAEQLIDVESYTDARWGIDDGRIEWADLGKTTSAGCQ